LKKTKTPAANGMVSKQSEESKHVQFSDKKNEQKPHGIITVCGLCKLFFGVFKE